MMFSVLIPSIASRTEKMMTLFNKIQAQIKDVGADVEILVLIDNKMRTIGYKREALVQSAMGEYLAFVDDDDDIYDNYIKEIIKAISISKADVIVFNEHISLNGGNLFVCHFGIEYDNQECHQENGVWVDITRKPFQSCVWKSSIAKSEHFPNASYGEDWYWCKRLLQQVKTQHRIDEILEKYTFDDNITEAEHVYPQE